MQRQSKGPGEEKSVVRTLSGRGFLVHNAHIQAGQARGSRCGFCQHGLDAVSTTSEVNEQGLVVVQDSGDNEKRDAPPPQRDEYTEYYESLQSGEESSS